MTGTEPIDLAARLARLAPDQRAAATASPGPLLCIAPAGSGKTTTLVARIAWLVAQGADPSSVAALTFNRRAAVELRGRLETAMPPGAAVRVRTFHALGMEILRDAGQAVTPLCDRDAIIREAIPAATAADRRRLDLEFSRLKLDFAADPFAIAADPEAGPIARAFVAYEQAIARSGGLDFDDLVARTIRALERDPALLERWRGRCAHLLVDEAQDLDRSQLRMAILLAAPANRIFLVGDDDQSIYGWRLADVRRLLGLAATSLPGLRRVDLEVNYRCPAVVVERAVRLVAHNEERFAKRVRTPPEAPGRVVLAATAADDVDRCIATIRSWPEDGGTRAILARTNRELLPAAVAAIALGVPFAAPGLRLPAEAPVVDTILDAVETASTDRPLLVRVAAARSAVTRRPHGGTGDPGGSDETAGWPPAAIGAAVLGWAAAEPTLESLRGAVVAMRAALADLRRDDAPLTLATAHATKGLEFDHVAVLGMDDGRFPSARAVTEHPEPDRALQEERRLAYVAWTRARRSLTLVYDPGAPSSFLTEAFDPAELGGRAPPDPAGSDIVRA